MRIFGTLKTLLTLFSHWSGTIGARSTAAILKPQVAFPIFCIEILREMFRCVGTGNGGLSGPKNIFYKECGAKLTGNPSNLIPVKFEHPTPNIKKVTTF